MSSAWSVERIHRVEASSPRADWDRFLGILAAYWSESFPDDDMRSAEWRKTNEDRMRTRLRQYPAWLWMYEHEGRPIAVANFYVNAGRGHIAEMYVHPSERRKGLGQFLIGAIRDVLREEGVSRLAVALPHHATDQVDFWRGAGFTEVAVEMELAIR